MANDDGLSLLDRLNIVDLGAEESRRHGEAPWSSTDRAALASHPAFIAMTQRAFEMGRVQHCPVHEEESDWVHRQDLDQDQDEEREAGYRAALKDMAKKRNRNAAGGRRLRGRVGRKVGKK
jgi:hypothetical protein